MWVVYHGYDFDIDGYNIVKRHEFDTLEQADSFCNDIFRKTGELVAVEFEN